MTADLASSATRARVPFKASPPPGIAERLVLRSILAALWLARRLPDGPIYRAAFALGAGLYLLMPARRRRVRRNLSRVCAWLVANDMASPRVAAAAREPQAMDRLVRSTFGHWLVTYAEGALAPRYSAAEMKRTFVASDPAASTEAVSARPAGQVGLIHLAMHFGSVDLSVLYGTRVGKLPMTGPMEVVESPLARAYFDHVRRQLGVDIVPVSEAAVGLVAALERGEAVGLVADRIISGSGSRVELFGAPTRLPVGPAVLSVQTGAPIYLTAIERRRPGRWLGHTVPIWPPAGVSRREATRTILELEARAFERIVARAPDQWTTLFFPIWSDEDER